MLRRSCLTWGEDGFRKAKAFLLPIYHRFIWLIGVVGVIKTGTLLLWQFVYLSTTGKGQAVHPDTWILIGYVAGFVCIHLIVMNSMALFFMQRSSGVSAYYRAFYGSILIYLVSIPIFIFAGVDDPEDTPTGDIALAVGVWGLQFALLCGIIPYMICYNRVQYNHVKYFLWVHIIYTGLLVAGSVTDLKDKDGWCLRVLAEYIWAILGPATILYSLWLDSQFWADFASQFEVAGGPHRSSTVDRMEKDWMWQDSQQKSKSRGVQELLSMQLRSLDPGSIKYLEDSERGGNAKVKKAVFNGRMVAVK